MLGEADDITTHASVGFKCMSTIKLSNEWTSIILFPRADLDLPSHELGSLLGLLWSWMYTSFACYFNISIQVKPPHIALSKLFHAYISFHGLEEGLASPSTSPWAGWLLNFPGVPCHSQNSSYFWKSGFHSAITNWFPQIFVINSETLLITASFLISECVSVIITRIKQNHIVNYFLKLNIYQKMSKAISISIGGPSMIVKFEVT